MTLPFNRENSPLAAHNTPSSGVTLEKYARSVDQMYDTGTFAGTAARMRDRLQVQVGVQFRLDSATV